MPGQRIQAKERLALETVVRGNTAFALDLYQKLRTIEGNLFFSPYSISTALAMTYAGARGSTETQMAQALHFTLSQSTLHPAFTALEARLRSVQEKGDILLQIANALWPHIGYPFLETFLTLTEEFYRVSITPVDYRAAEVARQQINTWVEEKTQTKIKNLIPPGVLDDLTRLVLVNAIYFKGNWASQFAKERTQTVPFLVTPSQKVEAPMMAQEHPFGYGETDRLQILELPYVGSDLSMIVLLPKEVDGLAELETALSAPNLELWTNRLWEKEVHVFLPRFKISQGVKLNHTLALMGMVDAFDELKANFSGMDGNENWLYIAAVLHKAFVDVNEEGTEAAAATAVIMGARGLPSSPPIFRADHPFVFLIRENSTRSILFLGRVVNPTLKDS
ncbi:MAG: serpin family protein [Anaerolineae bacterium]|nr:serpin family protein [Anaerolineae bacterium]